MPMMLQSPVLPKNAATRACPDSVRKRYGAKSRGDLKSTIVSGGKATSLAPYKPWSAPMNCSNSTAQASVSFSSSCEMTPKLGDCSLSHFGSAAETRAVRAQTRQAKRKDAPERRERVRRNIESRLPDKRPQGRSARRDRTQEGASA